MKTQTIMKIILLLMCVAMLQTCKEKPVDNNEPKLGKRNYKWSIDSIDYDVLPTTVQIEQMWGSSATDVWGVAGGAPDVRDCLWHYDGKKWRRATYNTPITDFTGNKTVYAIYGTAKNNIYTFGRKINQNILSAFIMHYDGTHWSDVTPDSIATLNSVLYTVYGVNKNNIWVGGYEYALHYDGNAWSAYKVADSMIVNSISGNDKKVYADTYSPWGNNSVFIYFLSDSNVRQVDNAIGFRTKFGSNLLATDKKLITFADGVISANLFKSGEIDTSTWKREFTTLTSFRGRFIQSSRNIFAIGVWNLIYHYNGVDWKQIFISIPNYIVDTQSDFWGTWADGNEVFICDTQNGIIYHGR